MGSICKTHTIEAVCESGTSFERTSSSSMTSRSRVFQEGSAPGNALPPCVPARDIRASKPLSATEHPWASPEDVDGSRGGMPFRPDLVFFQGQDRQEGRIRIRIRNQDQDQECASGRCDRGRSLRLATPRAPGHESPSARCYASRGQKRPSGDLPPYRRRRAATRHRTLQCSCSSYAFF